MKTRKMTSAALALVLSAVMAFGLAAPVRAMDFGLSGLDASLAAAGGAECEPGLPAGGGRAEQCAVAG